AARLAAGARLGVGTRAAELEHIIAGTRCLTRAQAAKDFSILGYLRHVSGRAGGSAGAAGGAAPLAVKGAVDHWGDGHDDIVPAIHRARIIVVRLARIRSAIHGELGQYRRRISTGLAAALAFAITGCAGQVVRAGAGDASGARPQPAAVPSVRHGDG